MTEKRKRGFAAMDPELRKQLASRGGQAAHAKGTAHQWTKEEARDAGRKGGVSVSQDREYMAAIGREGGGSRGKGTVKEEAPQGAARERETPVARATDSTEPTVARRPSLPEREGPSAPR